MILIDSKIDIKKIKDLWRKDIKFFKYSEFDSPDVKGSGLLMNFEFVRILDKIREKCSFPFKINSGYRTRQHNDFIKGEFDSSHLKGLAADISILNSRYRYYFIRIASEHKVNRLGISGSFIHVDIDYSKPQDVIWIY